MAPSTLVEVLDHVCRCFPDRPALRVKSALFQWSLRVGLAGRPLPWGLAWQRRLADRLVLGKLRDAVGGPKSCWSPVARHWMRRSRASFWPPGCPSPRAMA